MTRPIIITSINPFERLGLQLRCFRAWKNQNLQVFSVNCKSEIEALKAAGLSESDRRLAPIEETGQALFDKPVPRLRPMLRRVLADFPGEPVLLVNSDIYPAIHNSGIFDLYFRKAPALGLTRADVALPECAMLDQSTPYQGGLDAFLLQPERLEKALDLLEHWPAADRMAFGIPGWDYMFGMALLSPQVGGTLMDSGVFLHEIHAQAYDNINEFSHYIGPLRELDEAIPDDVPGATAQIAARIANTCAENREASELIQAIYFRRPEPAQMPSPEAVRICREMQDQAPWVRWNYNFHMMSVMAQHAISAPRANLEQFWRFFYVGPSMDHRFAEILLGVAFCIACNPARVHNLTSIYPLDNVHALAVEEIRTKTRNSPAETRYYIARLFAQEVFEHRILNPRLFNYLCLSCQNAHERRILNGIRNALFPEVQKMLPDPLSPNAVLPWEKGLTITPADPDMPGVSIVIPIYNSGAFLEKTLRSLMCNDLTGVELILMDGGSTDNTAEIVAHYQDIFAVSVSEKDRGQSDAINKGYDRATQPILYWLNGDDIILPNALVDVRRAFRDTPGTEVVVGNAYMTEIDFTPIRHFVFSPEKLAFEYLLDYAAHHLVQPSVFFSRKAWDQAGPVKEELHYAMDADLFLAMASQHVFHYIPVDIAYSVYHEECKTRGKRGESITELALVQARHGGFDQARKTLDILVQLFNEAEEKATAPAPAPQIEIPDSVHQRRLKALQSEISANRAAILDDDIKSFPNS